MRNYAKFCKLNIDNKKYQLNLTETGSDDAHFFNKMLSVLSLASPVFVLYKLFEILYNKFTINIVSSELISHLIAGSFIMFAFVVPVFESSKGFNAILRGILFKNKTKKFYKKIRNLEKEKNNINYREITQEQKKLTKHFLKKLVKITKKNERIKQKYNKIYDKKGYVDGMHAFVSDNIDSLQESVDKFIFHNKELLLKFCPEYSNFIEERYVLRYNVILNEENYYDEFIWSASHSKDNLIKNNCLNKGETSNYLNELKELFELEDLSVNKQNIKTYDYIDKTNNQTLKKEVKLTYDIYKDLEDELEK